MCVTIAYFTVIGYYFRMQDLLLTYEYLDDTPSEIRKAVETFPRSLVYPILLILGDRGEVIEVVNGGSTEDAKNRPDSYDKLTGLSLSHQ